MPDDLNLSPQDIADLHEIRSKLPQGHPTASKIDQLLASIPGEAAKQASLARNAQPTQFEQERANPPGFWANVWQNLKRQAAGAVNQEGGILQNIPGAMPLAHALDIPAAKAQLAGEEGRSLPYKAVAQVGRAVVPGLDVPGMEHAADVGSKAGVLGQAAVPAAEAAAPLAAEGAAGLLPSKAHARALFQEVHGAAKGLPVDTAAAGDSVLRAHELFDRGNGPLPQVLRKFEQRVTDPTKGPLTYEEARDFYSAGTRLSAEESKRTAPMMKAQVTEFTHNLDAALRETADHAGKLDEYAAAMKEYHGAAAASEIAKTVAKGLIPTGVGTYLLYRVLHGGKPFF